MEHRVEPQTWLTDGDAEAAAPEPDVPEPGAFGPQPDAFGFDSDGPAEAGSDYAEAASDYADRTPFNGAAGLPASAVQGPDNHDFSPPPPPASLVDGAAPMAPPYPASAPQGTAAKITAPFSMLTKTRTKPAKPARPAGPAKPAKTPGPAKPAKTTRPAKTQKKPGPRPQEGRPSPAQPGSPGAASTRKAQLVLSRVEPWSVMKFSFMISLVGWVVLFVAVAGIYFVLARIGVFHTIESTIGQVTFSKGHPGSNAASWFAASRVLGYTMLVGAINVVLITALATVGAVVYNLVTHLAGGIEVTLKETD